MAPFSFTLSKVRSYFINSLSLHQELSKQKTNFSPNVIWVNPHISQSHNKNTRHLPTVKSIKTSLHRLKFLKSLPYETSSDSKQDIDCDEDEDQDLMVMWMKKVRLVPCEYTLNSKNMAFNLNNSLKESFDQSDMIWRNPMSLSPNILDNSSQINMCLDQSVYHRIFPARRSSESKKKTILYKETNQSWECKPSRSYNGPEKNKPQETLCAPTMKGVLCPPRKSQWPLSLKQPAPMASSCHRSYSVLRSNMTTQHIDERVCCSLRIPTINVTEDLFWSCLYEREFQQYEKLAFMPHIMIPSAHLLHHLICLNERKIHKQKALSSDSHLVSQISTQDSLSSSQTQQSSALIHTQKESGSAQSQFLKDSKRPNVALSSSSMSFGHSDDEDLEDPLTSDKPKLNPLIRADIRESLIKWMNAITVNMKWTSSTFFVATHTFDSYLAQIASSAWVPHFHLNSNSLPLLSTACLFLGVVAVEEHTNAHKVKGFLKDVPNINSIEKVFIQQLDILGCLTDGLQVTRTPEDFIYYYLANMKFSEDPFLHSAYLHLLSVETELFISSQRKETQSSISLRSLIDCVLTLVSFSYEVGLYMTCTSSSSVIACMVPLLTISAAPELVTNHDIFSKFAKDVFKLNHASALTQNLHYLLPPLLQLALIYFSKGCAILSYFVNAASQFHIPQSISFDME